MYFREEYVLIDEMALDIAEHENNTTQRSELKCQNFLWMARKCQPTRHPPNNAVVVTGGIVSEC